MKLLYQEKKIQTERLLNILTLFDSHESRVKHRTIEVK